MLSDFCATRERSIQEAKNILLEAEAKLKLKDKEFEKEDDRMHMRFKQYLESLKSLNSENDLLIDKIKAIRKLLDKQNGINNKDKQELLEELE